MYIIIKLNKNEGGSAIFCLHPIGGNVLCYYKLARLLEDKYSIYGIQFPKIDAGKVPFTNISEMSKYYISQLKKIKPKGPYADGTVFEAVNSHDYLHKIMHTISKNHAVAINILRAGHAQLTCGESVHTTALIVPTCASN